MRKAILVLVCSVFFAQAAKCQVKMQLNWLEGDWTIKIPGGQIAENWITLNDSTYTGKSSLVKSAAKPEIQETIELKLTSGEWYFIPTVVNQNNTQPVKFRLIYTGKNEFIAENRDHDFPQRISYRRVGDRLFASIEGSKNGTYRKINFDYFLSEKGS